MAVFVEKYFVINKQHEVLAFFKDEYDQVIFPRIKSRGENDIFPIYKVLQEAGIIEKNKKFLFEQHQEVIKYKSVNGIFKKHKKAKNRRYYFVSGELTEEVNYKLTEICNQLGFTFSFVPIDHLLQLLEESIAVNQEQEESYREHQKRIEQEGVLKATKTLQYKMEMKEDKKC